MEFRNTLIMSLVLVAGFVCLHFYEGSVDREYFAHNSVMEKIVKENLEELMGIKYQIASDIDLYDKRDDVSVIIHQELGLSPTIKGQNSGRRSSYFLDRYDRNRIKSKMEGLSALEKTRFLRSSIDSLFVVMGKINRFKVNNARDGIQLIFKERPTVFETDKTYSLDLDIVDLQGDHNATSLHIGYDDHNMEVDHFPMKLPYLPEQITFYVKAVNQVTGEKYNGKEIHRP